MDKAMIHIDDLVRSRLQGGEEKERAGAWANMRELLDKDMPVTAPVPNAGNRRLYGLLLLLLLGSSLTVGGFQMAGHYRDSSDNTGGSAMLASTAAGLPQTSFASRNVVSAADLIPTNNHNPDLSKENNSTPSIKAAPAHNVNTGHLSESVTKQAIELEQEGPAGSNNDAGVPVAASASNAATFSTSGEQLSEVNTITPGAVASVKTTHSTRSPRVVVNSRSASVAADPDQPVIANQVTMPDGLRLLLRRDSMMLIEIAEHKVRSSDGTIHTPATLHRDTISMGRIAVLSPITPSVISEPVARRERASGVVQQHKGTTSAQSVLPDNIPAASTATSSVLALGMPAPAKEPSSLSLQAAVAAYPSTAADGSSLVSLSDYKVSSVKHSWWNPEQFNAAVGKIKYKVAGIEMYVGAEFGINASLGKGLSLGGFQCGVTGLIILSDILSINTGAYFYQRFNTGSTIQDDYVSVDKSTIHTAPITINNVVYNHYSWVEDSVDHHFNYDKVQTLELPLILRYGSGRFFGEGGVNFMYGFKMKADEITIHADRTILQQANYPTTQVPVFGSSPTVKSDDFGSRFGLGFAVGGGYHFSPAVTLNLRLTKTLWDNANTDGSRIISTNLYRLPSMQLSVGYRFSQQKAAK